MTELNLMPLGEQERCGQSPFVRSERTFPGLRRFSTQLVGYEAVLFEVSIFRSKTATGCRSFTVGSQSAYDEQESFR